MLRLVGQWRVDVRTQTPAVVDEAPSVPPGGDHSAPEPARVASLTFEGDGQVYGTGGVNRLRGTWSVDGDTLTFGPVASTLMAGPPAAMHQEAELLRLLHEPLELRAPDGTPVTALEPLADRPDPAGGPAADPTADPMADAAQVDLVAASGERLTLTREG